MFPIHTMKARGGGGMEVLLHSFLFSALYGGKWYTRGPVHFTLEEELLYVLNWRLDGFQSRFGHFGLEKNLLFLSRIKSPTVQMWASRYTDFACSADGICELVGEISCGSRFVNRIIFTCKLVFRRVHKTANSDY